MMKLNLRAFAGPLAVACMLALAIPATAATDVSVNAPTPPSIGATTISGGPFNGAALLKTLTTASAITVQNRSEGPILLVIDDGTAASGAAPTGVTYSVLMHGLPPASGQSWTGTVGRLRIFAQSSAAYVSIQTTP